MDAVLRGAAIYLFLLVIFRLSGKRSLEQTTTFDFVLLLIISEVIQQGVISTDNSLINAVVLVVTLVGLDIGLSLIKQRSERFEKLIDGTPLVIVDDGRVLNTRLNRERIDEDDILAAARQTHGLERMDQIKYAVLERGGAISIIPREK